MKITCETCFYFDPERQSGFKGKCRRNPPGVFVITDEAGNTRFNTLFPIVLCDEWCGEHMVAADTK